MANAWFDVSSLSHFWIKRRFEVLRHLMVQVPLPNGRAAEIGCGNGFLQVQLEELLGAPIDGFDLNEEALRRNQANLGDLYHYNVHQRHDAFRGRYHTIFLFDVIEHIREEDEFIESVLFHLSQGGRLYINVPAFPFLWSGYDVADGHFRRYTAGMLHSLASRTGLEVLHWTYWGLPLVPLLLMRKIVLRGKVDESAVRQGFNLPNAFLNKLLLRLSRCERLPQSMCGTSLMATLKRR